MNQKEYDTLLSFTEEPWNGIRKLKEYLKTVEIVEEVKGNRTGKQNNSLHLWFEQCAKVCRDAGVDAKVVFSATMHVEMTMLAVKSLWHALQTAFFGKKSTTELKKTGEIDILEDHMRRFFAEKIYVNGEHVAIELPPFPNDETRQKEEMGGYRTNAGEGVEGMEYPEGDTDVKF